MTRASYPTKSKEDLPQRRNFDSYPTELPLVVASIAEAIDINTINPVTVLDPGAGEGVWGRAAKLLLPNSEVSGVEIQDYFKPEGFDYWFVMDYLDFVPVYTPKFDFICGNPPFGGFEKPPKWEQFLHKSWSLLAPGGTIVFLLKVEVSTGLRRQRKLWSQLPPYMCLPCCPRPSHTGDRNTNKNDLALWIWKKDHRGQPIGTPGEWMTRPFDWVTKCRKVLELL